VGAETARQLRRAFKFGEEVHIPSEFVSELRVDAPLGLNETFASGSLTIGPVDTEAIALDGRMLLQSPGGRRLASLPIRFSERRLGNGGGTIEGSDPTESVRVELQFDTEETTLTTNLVFSPTDTLLPGALLSILRFTRHLSSPNKFQLVIGDTPTADWKTVPSFEKPEDEFISLIEDLDRIQAVTATPFPVPKEFTAQDVRELRRAVKFIDGEELRVPAKDLSTVLNVTNPETVEAWASSGEWFQVALVSDGYSVQVAGVDIPLGRVLLHAPGARVANADEVLAALRSGNSSVPLTFELMEDRGLIIKPAASESPSDEPMAGPSKVRRS